MCYAVRIYEEQGKSSGKLVNVTKLGSIGLGDVHKQIIKIFREVSAFLRKILKCIILCCRQSYKYSHFNASILILINLYDVLTCNLTTSFP
jgi:hypothetical protein